MVRFFIGKESLFCIKMLFFQKKMTPNLYIRVFCKLYKSSAFTS